MYFQITINSIVLIFLSYLILSKLQFGKVLFKTNTSKILKFIWFAVIVLNIVLLVVDMVKGGVQTKDFLSYTFWIMYGLTLGFAWNSTIYVRVEGITADRHFISWDRIEKFYFEDDYLKIKLKDKNRIINLVNSKLSLSEQDKLTLMKYVEQNTKPRI